VRVDRVCGEGGDIVVGAYEIVESGEREVFHDVEMELAGERDEVP
jgi:acetyl-CoA acetyltransferase